MGKVLVIRKPDRTIHSVSMNNKATLMAFSNRLPVGQKWKFEEMDEEEAAKLPMIDPNYVSAGEASVKLTQLESESKEKDAEIEELKKQLAAMQAGGTPAAAAENVANVTEPTVVKGTVAETVAKINMATTIEDVNKLAAGDDRKGVIDAAQKKVASLL